MTPAASMQLDRRHFAASGVIEVGFGRAQPDRRVK